MPNLDPRLWATIPGVETLFDALDAQDGRTRLVGGAVRDHFLGLPVADIDLATTLRPKEVMARLEASGLKAIPTGLAHGTVTAIVHGRPFEVTTLRRDVATDGRHAEVVYTDDWKNDAARRDFTINALYADPLTGKIHDYFGGIEDLRQRAVRFIGNPLARIAEDHLRILRFFRFTARFATAIDAEGLSAATRRATDLRKLSRERIRQEFLKLLVQKNARMALEAMVRHEILTPILPEIGEAGLRAFAALEERERDAGAPPSPVRRFAALLPPDADLAADMAQRLRLSRQEKQRLALALGREPVAANITETAYRIGTGETLDRLLLLGDRRAIGWAREVATWARPDLPIHGRDIIAMGVAAGPEVSRILKQVEELWIRAGFPSDRAEVMAIAERLVK